MKTEFERVTPESVGIPSEVLLKYLDSLSELQTEMHGLMLMRHGKVCAEGWWAPYGRDVKHGSNSLAKTYTGTAIGLAVTESLLSLDDRLVDIFPEYASLVTDEKMRLVRVRDMLSMSAGFAEEEFGPTDSIDRYMARPLAYEPGEKFFYHNGTASALGAIVQKKIGMSMEEYLDQKLFRKIGIETENFEWLKEAGTGLDAAAGGILSTTEQNLRLMQLYANGGMACGEQLLSKEFAKEAVQPHHIVTSHDTGYLEGADISYNWMMWGSVAYNAYFGRGALGQIAMVMPDYNLILSLHQNSTRKGDLDAVEQFWEIVVPHIQNAPIEGSGEAFHILKDRLSQLKLQDAAPSERPAFERTINGRSFICEEGFDLENETFNMMTKAPKGETVKGFRFMFDDNTAAMLCPTSAGEQRITVGLDGASRYNVFKFGSGYAQETLVCGRWTGEQIFEVFIRWLGFSKCKVYRFEFGAFDLKVFGFLGNKRMDEPLYQTKFQ
ncbi:MAG: serine hydrolase [Lachnospiraceae bacterium]|nr:serine hydrolase [Lachnospiraceae bacterium]MBR6350488.1 serine hydrolase [Lachnospiraceae bacterium]